MTISQVIQRYRKEKGYSQEYMASQLNLSQATYSRLEKCDTACIKRLVAIARVLGTVPDTFLTYTSSNTRKPILAVIPSEPQLKTMPLGKDEVIRYQAEEITFLREQISYLQAVWHQYREEQLFKP